ncbi:MAG TPA: M48 family metallopeptidase [Bacillota bacterium]|mgnify:CR=1 FL=1|nr:M48 family metallopeptidase [Bacillota bacterium]HOK64623.1 M48 family metallopeptidase [Bacillota bacterium]HOL12124.1 M48 family metallopeptidase [Bacillota bacterium]HOQ03238.1 M48 family metallopeptidase [Bacillota bacterium]HPP60961.1 M48 family metallopeptidase [Bacillota bacterium]
MGKQSMLKAVGSSETGTFGGSLMKALLIVCFAMAIGWIISSFLPRPIPENVHVYFHQSYLDRAFQRADRSYLATGIEGIVTFLTLYLFVTWKSKGAVTPNMSAVGPISSRSALLLGANLALQCCLLLVVVGLPFAWYKGYYLEKTFGLSRLTLGGWFLEFIKGTFLQLIVYAVIGGVAAFVIVRFPTKWSYILTILFFLGSILVAYIYPIVVAPLFNKFVPLEDETLLSEVKGLFAQADIKVDKVLVMEASRKTARSNAYFSGVGNTKQVVLYDNLIQNQLIEEIKLVLSHELGHWKLGHILKGVLLTTVGTFVILTAFSLAFGSSGATLSTADFRRLFLYLVLFCMLASYALTPVSSYVSRKHEIEADLFSLELTKDPDVFIAAMVSLARANLSDVSPPPYIRWFAWTHPTTLERIALAEEFRSSLEAF